MAVTVMWLKAENSQASLAGVGGDVMAASISLWLWWRCKVVVSMVCYGGSLGSVGGGVRRRRRWRGDGGGVMVMGGAMALMAVTSTSQSSIFEDKRRRCQTVYLYTGKERRPPRTLPVLFTAHLSVGPFISPPSPPSSSSSFFSFFVLRVQIPFGKIFNCGPWAKWMKLLHSFVLSTETNRFCHFPW